MSGPVGSSQWMYSSGKDTLTIPYSCRFDYATDAYLNRTPSSASNRKTWTFSCWFKRGCLGAVTGPQNIFGVTKSGGQAGSIKWGFHDDDTIRIDDWHARQLATQMVFRDPSAWYHIILAWDTTQATDTNRVKLYVNGSQVTLVDLNAGTGWGGYPDQNDERYINDTEQHCISTRNPYASDYELDGLMAEVHFIDGIACDADDFGKTGTYGEWLPVEYTGSYGTNGFHLDFADSGNLGDDESGNGHDWAENNIAATDQMIDTPSNNFPTVPEGFGRENGDALNHTDGNLRISMDSNDGTEGMFSSWNFPASGKWYYEICIVSGNHNAGSGGVYLGIFNRAISSYLDGYQGGSPQRPGMIYVTSGDWNASNAGAYWPYNQGVLTTSNLATTTPSYTAGDIYQLAVDIDNNKYWHGYNNSWIGLSGGDATHGGGNPANATNPDTSKSDWSEMAPWAMITDQQTANSIHWNFGQDSSFAGAKTAQGNQDGNSIGDFFYTPPTGFLAMCTSNLPAVAVTPSEYFKTKLYTGTASSNAITGVGFQPDLVWAKSRAITASNALMDAIRGANKPMWADVDSIEATSTSGNDLGSFDADGFTLAGGSNQSNINASSAAYVSWNWKAGNATLGTGDFTQGSIASTCSRSAAAGFSIVSYTGSGTTGTVGHGLSVVPEFYVVKNRDSAGNWAIFVESEGNAKRLDWDTANAPQATNNWNSTSPSSTVFTVYGGETRVNDNGDKYIAYCFHSVDGYSKIGTYRGNASADGTFVYTGFRPAFVLLKQTDTGDDWGIYDNERITGHNGEGDLGLRPLRPDENGTEGSGAGREMDLLSNGFKLRTNNATFNEDTDPYVYLAFAETPFKYANAR